MTAEQLKRARKVLGLDQTELAKRLGVHPVTLSRWERGFSPVPKAVGELLHVWTPSKQNRPKGKS